MATLENLGYVIRRRRVAKKINQTRFAELIGYDGQSSVSRLEHGKQDVPAETLSRIAEALETRPSILWLEAETHALAGEIPPEFSVAETTAPYTLRVPIISWVQAGLPTEAFDPYERGAALGWAKTNAKFRGRPYALIVRGDSMLDPRGQHSFPEGTVIIVDPGRQAENGSFVIVRFEGAREATFKRLREDGGRRLLLPMNPAYPTQEIQAEATLCGVVVSQAEKEFAED